MFHLIRQWMTSYFIHVWLIFLFLPVWFIVIVRAPDDHPYMSDKQRDLIISQRCERRNLDAQYITCPPYSAILRTTPVYGYLLISARVTCVTSSMFAKTPTFLNKTLQFSPIETGILMSIIYSVRVICSFMWASSTKLLVSYKSFSTNKIRKIILTSGLGFT